MKNLRRRLSLVIAGATLAVAIVPGTAQATTNLNVCTWLTQQVGDAVGAISAAPGAVLGPNNGGSPGGDKGPFPISFTSTGTLLSSVVTGSSSCG